MSGSKNVDSAPIVVEDTGHGQDRSGSLNRSSTSIVQQTSPCNQLNSVTQSSSPSFTSVPNTMTLVQHSESSVLTESLSTPKTTPRSQSSA